MSKRKDPADESPAQINGRRSDEALRHILAMIFEGRLAPGSRLPAERELAEVIGVSRPTLRDALNKLEARGYVNRRSKSGNYVCTALPQPFRDPIEEIVNSDVVGSGDIIEIRKILELWAVCKAAESPSRAALGQLGDCLKTMSAASPFRSDGQVAKYSEADFKFHQVIAEMTENVLYIHLFHFFIDLVKKSISLSRQMIPGNYAADNLRLHEEILRAIKQKDAERAKRAMLDHFEYVEKHISSKKQQRAAGQKKIL